MIDIITYNILSPNLCNSEEFNNYNVDDLDGKQRKSKLILLIDEWTSRENSPIICLQEVPNVWKGSLEKIFLNRNYNFFSYSYGNKKSGYFGVLTAVPRIYEVEKIEYIPIGEHIFTNEIPKNPKSFMDKWVDVFLERKEVDLVESAKERSNIAIKLALKMQKQFVIYNYHMPCAFRTPLVQTLHVDALKRLMKDHDGVPTVLTTDFNLTPDSVGYKYFTSGELPIEHMDYLIKSGHINFNMESSFLVFNGKEPEFTCYSDTRWGGEFKNTLDYIFVSKHWKVLSSRLLINTTDKMPNMMNPSDHLPMESSLEIN